MKKSTKKGDKGEERVIEEINSWKEEQLLINNLILMGDKMSHQFDHILIRHNGVFIIETKYYYGDISGSIDDLYWCKSFKKKGKIINEKFMNPIKQNNAHIRFIKKILGKDIPLINFVVFIDNDVSKLGIYNVINLSQLHTRISSWEIDKELSLDTMNKINNYLLYLEADIQVEDHVNNIHSLQKERKDKKKESILAMEKGICPICGNKISMNKNIYFCNKCRYTLKV